MADWLPGKVPLLKFGKPRWLDCHLHAGLGLRRLTVDVPDIPFTPIWCVYHLGSGHVVVHLICAEPDAFRLATEIAGLGDWTFDGVHGWRNSSPDLSIKLHALISRNPHVMRSAGQGPNEVVARQVLEMREAAAAKKRRRTKS